MIYEGSRYERNAVCPLTQEDGTIRSTIMHRGPQISTYAFFWYTWRDGDRVDLLAFNNFSDERLWWQIADANPEVLWWDDVPMGTQIRIPNGAAL